MLATQTVGNLGSQATQHFVIGINHEPVAFDFMRFSGKGFHDPTSAQRTISESRAF
jgi:hypothetical protein